MQISEDQTREDYLAALGVRAAKLLCLGDFATLGDTFGYALAFGREPAAAIRAELAESLGEHDATALDPSNMPTPLVTYFQPNDSGLLALVQQQIGTNNGGNVLLELIVITDRSEKHVSLEQISATA